MSSQVSPEEHSMESTKEREIKEKEIEIVKEEIELPPIDIKSPTNPVTNNPLLDTSKYEKTHANRGRNRSRSRADSIYSTISNPFTGETSKSRSNTIEYNQEDKLDGQEKGIEKKEPSFINFLLYLIENEIAAYSNFTFLLIGLLFIFFYVLFGLLWYFLGMIKRENWNNDDENQIFGTTNLNDALYLSLQMLVAAGYDDSIPSGNGLRTVSFLMIATGLVVFAILVGFITDAVTTYMDNLKVGSTEVEEENHTIVLGWNEATARSIVQMAFLRRMYQKGNEEASPLHYYFPFLYLFWRPIRPSTSISENDIIVLCNNRTKDEMHTAINNIFNERGINKNRTCLGRNIVCRIGDPTDINDLLRVGVHKASAILVQVTEGDSVEEEASQGIVKNGITLRTALAIRNAIFSNLRNNKVRDDLRIILQLSKPSSYVDALCFHHDDNVRKVVIPMEMSLFLNIWLFKCSIKPRLVGTLMDILNFEGISIRRRKVENLASGEKRQLGDCIGKTFEEIQSQFMRAIVFGLVRPSKSTRKDMEEHDLGLLCHPQTIIEKGDLLIFLDETPNPETSIESVALVQEDRVHAAKLLTTFEPTKSLAQELKKNIIICGWRSAWAIDPGRLRKRMEETASQCPPGSSFIFVNFVKVDDFEKMMKQIQIPKKELLTSKNSNDNTDDRLPFSFDHLDDFHHQVYEIKSIGLLIHHINGDAADPYVMEQVLSAYNNNITTAILMGTQADEEDPASIIDVPPKSKDTRVLSIILLLRKICIERSELMDPIHIVAENQEDMTTRLALPPRATGLTARVIQPDFVNCQAIYARTLVQTLAYPIIQETIMELFDEDPSTCSLEKYKAANFLPLGKDLSFGIVQQLVIQQKTFPEQRFLCIGILVNDETVQLMPDDSVIWEYTENDYLIVFCRHARFKNS